MSTLKEQFELRDAHKPKPTWVYGDRVSGKLSKIPVVGTVIREDYHDSSLVLVHADLPIVDDDGDTRWVFLLPAKSIKRLKEVK